jgi:serine/threonine protein kinase
MDPTPQKPTPKSAAPAVNNPPAPKSTQEATQVFADTVQVPPSGQKTAAPGSKGTETQSKGTTGATEAFHPKPATAGAPTKVAPTSPPTASLEPTDPLADLSGKSRSAKLSKKLDATGDFVEKRGDASTQLLSDSAPTPPPRPAPPAAPEGPQLPHNFGDFRLDKKLGEGGMGAVYQAHQISMDRIVAIKVLTKKLATNQDFVLRFKREAQTMAKVDHPNIVRGIAVGDVDGQHYVAMEFIDGQSIQKWMDKLGKLSVADAVHVALCTAYALQHAHEKHLVHRDIKPDNILMTKNGVVKLADLGLAKKTDDELSLTQSGTGFGTPYYMPLEQYRDAKHVDARADIYALGVTLYYLLTGKLPFYGATHFDVIKSKEAAKFVAARRHNPEIPERLDLMIDKMIQKERTHRYQSCAEIIEALDSLGLASDVPSFVAKATPASGKASAPTVRVGQLPQRTKVTAPPPAEETPDMWTLRYKDEKGQRVKKQVSSGRLKQLIERDEIDLVSATVMRAGDEAPRPIASIREFASLVQSKMVKAKADRRSQKLDTAYAKIERDASRRRIFKAIDNFFRNLTSVIILIAVIAALVVGGWWLFRNKDSVMQKVQDAAKSVQESGGKPNSSPEATPQSVPAP